MDQMRANEDLLRAEHDIRLLYCAGIMAGSANFATGTFFADNHKLRVDVGPTQIDTGVLGGGFTAVTDFKDINISTFTDGNDFTLTLTGWVDDQGGTPDHLVNFSLIGGVVGISGQLVVARFRKTEELEYLSLFLDSASELVGSVNAPYDVGLWVRNVQLFGHRTAIGW
jgi:hypothetical protein